MVSVVSGDARAAAKRASSRERREHFRALFAAPAGAAGGDRRSRWVLGPIPPNVEARFWSHVDKNGPIPPLHPELGPCWPWTAGRSNKGYGIWFPYDGVNFPAHRFALTLKLRRDLAVDEVSRHQCHVRPCCNPDHIIAGSQSNNLADSVRDQVAFVGELNPMAHLTAETVMDLRRRAPRTYQRGWFAGEARRLGINHVHLAELIRGDRWAHLPGAVDVSGPLRGLLAPAGSDHCYRGHLKEGTRPDGRKRCRKCVALNQRTYRARQKAATETARAA